MRTSTRILTIGLGLCVLASLVPAQEKAGKSRRGASREGKLKVGDPAHDFTLASLDGKQQATLSDFRGERPVALIFGSYT